MWIKCWINAWMNSCIFAKVWWIFCMMCMKFRSALMQAVWTHDKTFVDGGYACRIFWGWLDACFRIVLEVSKVLQIWIQPLEMHMAWNHKNICKIWRTVQIFGLRGHNRCMPISAPVMILENIGWSNGQCNGTQAILTLASSCVLEVCILGGEYAGHTAFPA